MKVPNLSHATRIARVEVRRSVRAVRSSNTRTAAFGVALLFWVALPTFGGGFLAYRLGQELPEVPFGFPVLDAVRGGAAVGWVGLAALAAARTAGKKGELDSPEGVLTTVPARDAALGLLLAEYARMATVAAIPVVTVAAALAVGAGAVAPLLAVPATAAVLLGVGLAVGFPVGIGVKWITLRTPWLARHRTALLVAAFALYFVAITSEAFDDVVSVLQRALRDTPLAWFGDAALLGLPGISAVPVHAVGAAALAAVLLPALAAVGLRSATTLWYTDRAQTTGDESDRKTADGAANGRVGATGEDESSAGERTGASSVGERALAPLSGVLARPTRIVTLAVWRRTKRSPIRLLYVAYPLFLLYAPLRTAFETGVSTVLPVVLALYGTWAAGATVLNPLGDEGSVLPTTLLSGIDGRQFVAGHVLSAALFGVPVVALTTAVAGALSPLAPAKWLTVTAATAVLVVSGTVLAVAVGTLFPRFGTVEVFRSREVTMPSKGAFAAYSLALVGGAVGAMVALLAPLAGFAAGVVGVPAIAVRAVGGVLAVSVGVVGPAAGFRWAARKFETFVVD
ncbi:hypothetical protein M0R89_05550 [Halorussus limi]|uniref:Uncharacterized protein n=1 Tax=Halorussus limi TaxID=2938695 RepID=A0A8U0HWS4_9EURY|nr:hypothetical protein [Halorussus limi]UPV75530.1 hypothetical protein M0R89_05550 [Halorussus limi]